MAKKKCLTRLGLRAYLHPFWQPFGNCNTNWAQMTPLTRKCCSTPLGSSNNFRAASCCQGSSKGGRPRGIGPTTGTRLEPSSCFVILTKMMPKATTKISLIWAIFPRNFQHCELSRRFLAKAFIRLQLTTTKIKKLQRATFIQFTSSHSWMQAQIFWNGPGAWGNCV